jgi:hypothetical protein
MPVLVAVILAPLATLAVVVAAMSPIAYAVAVVALGVALFATSSSSPTAYLNADTGPIIDSVAAPIGVAAVRADRVVRIGGLSIRIAAPVWSTDAAPSDVAIARSALLREMAHLEGCIANARRSRHRSRCSHYLGRYAAVAAQLDALQ